MSWEQWLGLVGCFAFVGLSARVTCCAWRLWEPGEDEREEFEVAVVRSEYEGGPDRYS